MPHIDFRGNINFNFAKFIVNFKKDFFASLVVFLVALPLCVGISVASGLPPEAGILSGIIGGIIVGSFSGSPLQVSGPAAGLIIIVHEIIQMQGIQALGIIVLLAGLMQIAFGLFKLGHWFRAISPAIIQGMLSGIGVSILFSQLYIMLDATPKKTFFENLKHLPSLFSNGIFNIDGTTHHIAALIGLITIAIILLWEYLPKKYKLIPATLVAVVLVGIVSFIFHLPIKYISISGNIFQSMNFLPITELHNLFNKDFFLDALSIAFIASAETLLTSTALDKMTTLYKTDYSKEILAQGIGNSIAGIIGAIPITGVIVRSAANIQTGARTRMSTIMHGIWILIFVTAIPFIFKFIPAASLAAILVYTGYKLINFEAVKNIYRISKGEFVIFMVTIVAILSTNLLEGILIGLFAGVVKSLYKLTEFDIKVCRNIDENEIDIQITGNLTFLRLPQIAEIIENIEPSKKVAITFKNTNTADHSIIDLLVGWAERYSKGKGQVIIDWERLKKIYPNFGWEHYDIKNSSDK